MNIAIPEITELSEKIFMIREKVINESNKTITENIEKLCTAENINQFAVKVLIYDETTKNMAGKILAGRVLFQKADLKLETEKFLKNIIESAEYYIQMEKK